MNKKYFVFLSIILVLVIAIIIALTRNHESVVLNSYKEGTAEDIAADKKMMQDENRTKEQIGTSTEKTIDSIGKYEVYSTEKLAYAKSGPLIIFFKANWCPTCRALDRDIKNNLNNIPKNVSILEIDYDNSVDLKAKYSVTVQHTLVQIDKNGNLIKKWIGSPTLKDLVGQAIM